MENALSKLLLKIHDKESNSDKWVHLCYVPEDLYELYKTQKQISSTEFNLVLSGWVKQDFDRDINITSAAELEEFKTIIRNYYKEAYPDVYLNQSTDRQGWMRVWITKKMKEDLKINGE